MPTTIFEVPATPLKTEAETTADREATLLPSEMNVYEYPGGFIKSETGESIASRRLDEIEAETIKMVGKSYARCMMAGRQFDLVEHFRDDYNSTYVVRWVKFNVDQEKYENEFEAFPADVVFRPPRITPKPKIYGTQTAVVVGKSGEEIFTDAYGRVKIQFHWDQDGQKDENSSCWVRVAQIWAGKSWGTLFTPRIGTEVIVSFLNGDPDCPIIVGTVYNDVQKMPYTLPGDMTKSTILTRSSKEGSAGNEIRFEDKKDSEEIYVHGQKGRECAD